MNEAESNFLLVWDAPEGVKTVLLERSAGQMPTPELRGVHAQLTPLLKKFMKEVSKIRHGGQEPEEDPRSQL